MSILIVDDSPDQRTLLETILRQAGHAHVRLAGSAREAYQELGMDRDNQVGPAPDLILLDIMMPGISGVEACRTIKACSSLNEIPIIMVTAKTDTSYLQEAFAAGAIDFLTKPVNTIELTARVASALTLKREMDRRRARERDLAERNQQLERALAEVKVLRGLIPICAGCKKIRNDHGYWQQIEEYIQDHSEAAFSHGLCLPCAKRLYPGVYPE
ncbi:MAG: response regulator [Nitrospiraceae bacterium]